MKMLDTNTIELSKSDLLLSLDEINEFPRKMGATGGLTRVFYKDEHDAFAMLLQPSNLGFSVSCRLNNRQSFQLNGVTWSGFSKIGSIMLSASNAPKQMKIEDFFQ